MMAVMKAIANTLSRNIAILALPGVLALDLTGPHEVFSLAGQLAAQPGPGCYRLLVLAGEAGPVATASGLTLVAEH